MSNGCDFKKISFLFFSQVVFTVLFSLSFYFIKGDIAGLSAVLGGLVYCVPAALASIFMSRADKVSAVLILAKAYLGMFYKTVMTIVLFIYIFKNVPINIGVFLSAYTVGYVTQYIMSYVLNKHN